MVDETRHAQQAFGFASVLASEALGPAALDVEHLETSLLDVVRLAVREGCIGERCAALEAREAAAHAADPELARLLPAVADDETRHAADDSSRRACLALRELAPGQAREQVAAVLRQELGRFARARRRSLRPTS